MHAKSLSSNSDYMVITFDKPLRYIGVSENREMTRFINHALERLPQELEREGLHRSRVVSLKETENKLSREDKKELRSRKFHKSVIFELPEQVRFEGANTEAAQLYFAMIASEVFGDELLKVELINLRHGEIARSAPKL